MKQLKILTLYIALIAAMPLTAQKITRAEYLLRYKDIAVEHMEKYGIPASIKMAQGMLESDNGNSRLATEANNHFGIKCKAGWTGATSYHDDDAPDECFRRYASAEDSWVDHSEFLDKGARYQFLFDLDPMDYKAWARGLKEAGYATNPRYPELLIKIIEDNELYLLDKGVEIPIGDIIAHDVAREASASAGVFSGPVDVDNYVIAMSIVGGYGIYDDGGVPFIVAREGDDVAKIAGLLGIPEKKLRRFNGLGRAGNIAAGSKILLERKNKK